MLSLKGLLHIYKLAYILKLRFLYLFTTIFTFSNILQYKHHAPYSRLAQCEIDPDDDLMISFQPSLTVGGCNWNLIIRS